MWKKKGEQQKKKRGGTKRDDFSPYVGKIGKTFFTFIKIVMCGNMNCYVMDDVIIFSYVKIIKRRKEKRKEKK